MASAGGGVLGGCNPHLAVVGHLEKHRELFGQRGFFVLRGGTPESGENLAPPRTQRREHAPRKRAGWASVTKLIALDRELNAPPL